MHKTAIILLVLFFVLIGAVFFATVKLLPGLLPILKQPNKTITEYIDDYNKDNNKTGPSITLPGNQTGMPLTLPPGFGVGIFARDLGKVRDIINAPDGGLLASQPSQGQVVALPDLDQNGRADGVFVVVEGLYNPHGLMLMCEEGDICQLYIAETNAVAVYDYDTKRLKATNRKKIIDLPDDGGHYTRSLLRHTIDGEEKLLISVGSSCNVCEEKDWRRAAILVSDLDGQNLEVFASGLRNSVFMDTEPITGEVWATDMGRDWLGDELPPEEINIIKAGQNYGWPVCYGRQMHDTDFDKNQYIRNPCEDTEPAHIEMPAHSAPLGIAFIGEEGWDEEYWYNALVAYHGSWNRSQPTGYKVVRMKFDAAGNFLGEEDFISGWLSGNNEALGRPVDILVRPGGVVFISDDKAGVIYYLKKQEKVASPEPIGVSQPRDFSYIDSPLLITGEAIGPWFFEGDFPVILLDANNNVLTESYVTAQGEWMTEDRVPFSAMLKFDVPTTESGKLVFKKDNPSGQPELDEEYEMLVRFKKTTYLAGESCEVTSDCRLPVEFAIRSSCPYEVQCIDNACTVICPAYQN